MMLSHKPIKVLSHRGDVDKTVGVLSQGNVPAARTSAVLAEGAIEGALPPGFVISNAHEFVRKAKLFRKPVVNFDSEQARFTDADHTAMPSNYPATRSKEEAPLARKRAEPPDERITFRLNALQWG